MNRKVKLLCFPYAGGSAEIYNKWKPFLDPHIELVPVELAGRGRRIREPHYNDISALIKDIFPVINREIGNVSYALFGHSMGARIAYELALEIKKNNLANPIHIFFSGRGAPHPTNYKMYHLMSPDEFKNAVIGLGGTPPEFFENSELLDLFLPLLKNDFKLSETPNLDSQICPLDVDITVLLGREDVLTNKQCHKWGLHTKGTSNIQYFDGGHFFLNNQTESIVRLINTCLIKYYTD